MKKELTAFTPGSVVAGRFDLPDGEDLYEATYLNAATLLLPHQPRFCARRHAGQVWFLAAPAGDFDEFGEIGTALANALPGGCEDRGEGAYTLDLPNGQAVLIRRDGRVKVFVGEPLQVSRFIDHEFDAEEHSSIEPREISHAPELPWISLPHMQNREALDMQRRVLKVGLITFLVAAGLWVGAETALAYASGRTITAISDQQAALKSAADRLIVQTVSVPNALRRHDDFFVNVMRVSSGARIRYFKWDAGKESFEVEFPLWTMADDIARLGKGIHTDLDPVRQVVVARKTVEGN